MMNIKSYLVDRLPYGVVYFLNVLIVLIVVQLGLLQRGTALEADNLYYILLLSAVLLLLFFVIDYVRQRSVYQKVNAVLDSDQSRDEVFLLRHVKTREQGAFKEIVEQQYRYYTRALATYRERQNHHVQFINQWVHQMKTPVSAIRLLAEQAQEMAHNQSLIGDTLESIQEENEKMVHSLDMMLHTARLDAFTLDMKPDRVNVVDVIRAVLYEHKKLCIRYAVFPKLEAEKKEVTVETDKKWIRFVFNQLIVNAIKYSRSDSESKMLWIHIFQDDDNWCVSIRDEGVGIPSQDLQRVFDPFFTGENGRRFPESTGMGLYLAKQVCDRLGHRLRMASSPGKGTTVTVTFPKNRHLYATGSHS